MGAFGKKAKPVQMIDTKRNKVIKTFESIADAGRFMDNQYARIYINNCCLGRTKTALGFKWKFVD